MTVAGIVLAGGMSRRFQSDKACEPYKNGTFLSHAYTELKAVSDSVAVSGRKWKDPEITSFEDCPPFKGLGPLAGIYSAMKIVKSEWYLVLACDMPLIDRQTLSVFTELKTAGHSAVVPVINGKVHPLCAMYHCSLLPVLQKPLEDRELKMMSLLHAAEPLMLDQSHFDRPDQFANINKKEDLVLLNESKFQHERSL